MLGNFITRLVFFTLCSLLIACNTAKPVIDTDGTPKNVDGQELYPVRNSLVDTAYVNPDVDFTRYTSIYLSPVNYSALKIVQPGNLSKSQGFTLDKTQKTAIDSIYRSSMTRQLSRDYGYRIVSIPEARTLIIDTSLVELKPNATNVSKRDMSARSKVYSEGAGEMVITADFKDGKTNAVIATIKDRKKSIQLWGENNQASNQRDIEQFFSSWGRMLRDRLDQLNKEKDRALN